jgi:hypothetical protein
MKTHIIQLEQQDDLISIRDKMSWAKSERILLVWPPRRKVNIRPLDIVLLQRHARTLGAQLGIASRSGEIRRSAMESHIPAFRTSSEAQLAPWGEAQNIRPALKENRHRFSRPELEQVREGFSGMEPDWLKNPVARIGIFASGVLAVLILFILFFPSAIIRINPVTQLQSATIPVTIDPAASAVNISGVIPAYAVSTAVEGDGEAPATGMMTIHESRASGTVEFSNLGEPPVHIPEGTIIRTVDEPAVRFIVTQSGEVPEGVGKKLELPVRAVEGGFAGNLDPNTLQAIEGKLGLSLSVTNPEPTTGGGDEDKSAATSEDRTRLYQKVTESLSQKAWEEIQKQVPAGGSLFHETLTSETVSETYNPPEGSPGPTVSLALKQKYTAYFMAEADLRSLGGLVLDASIPNGFEPLTGTLTIKSVSEPFVTDDGKMTWQVSVDRSVAARVNPLDVISEALGRTPETAMKNLSELKMASSPQISISPSWWPWMPSLPMRVSVESNH